jgi:choline dehydrogenase-like flavoprotein
MSAPVTPLPDAPRFGARDDVDFVVIGAGAAGGILAKELATTGLRVVLMDQGPYLTERHFTHDEVAIFDEHLLTNDHRKRPNTFRKTESEEAVAKGVVTYGSMVGGGSVHFTANYWRFHEIDFVERSRIGPIAGTGFADWPLTYAELEPYYAKAERELGVSGEAGSNPFDPPRSGPYPLPPLPVKSSGVLFERAARKLGWHPFPAPMAILSRPYMGRSACQGCGFCFGFGCEYGAKSSTLATVIRVAERSGNCEIRPECYVRRIETNNAGRVTGVTYFDRDGKEQFQGAKAVVLSANGAETPRLLLLSESSLFPHGLANSSGLVGKYLMFNGWTAATGLFDEQLHEYKGAVVGRILQDFYESDPRRGYYGGGGLDARFDYTPVGFALSGLPPELPKWGPEYKAALRHYYTRVMQVLGHTTSLPVESNSISLDPTVRDAWGVPALRVTYRDHADDMKIRRFILDRSLELLEAAGARRIWSDPVEEQTDTMHLLGTCRMGNDPRASVVDRNHRAHDVPNLFICDGSSFVTSGRGQPTCTIQALAFRAGELIARAARLGEI